MILIYYLLIVVEIPARARADILGLSDTAPNTILGKEFPAPSMELIIWGDSVFDADSYHKICFNIDCLI